MKMNINYYGLPVRVYSRACISARNQLVQPGVSDAVRGQM